MTPGSTIGSMALSVSLLASAGVSGAVAGTVDGEERPLEAVLFDGSGDSAAERMATSRATVLLTDLHRVDAVSSAAALSMQAPDTYRKPVGVMAPAGTVAGDARTDAPLLRVDRARVTVRHIRAEDAVLVEAGYLHAVGSGDERRPWMLVISDETESLPLECDFEVRSGLDPAALSLREVVAIDDRRVYMKAVLVEEETGRQSEEFLVAADYAFAAAGTGPGTR